MGDPQDFSPCFLFYCSKQRRIEDKWKTFQSLIHITTAAHPHQMTRREGELLPLLKHSQSSEMSQRPKSHQAQKVRSGCEKGGRQVLTEQLLFLESFFCLIASS